MFIVQPLLTVFDGSRFVSLKLRPIRRKSPSNAVAQTRFNNLSVHEIEIFPQHYFRIAALNVFLEREVIVMVIHEWLASI